MEKRRLKTGGSGGDQMRPEVLKGDGFLPMAAKACIPIRTIHRRLALMLIGIVRLEEDGEFSQTAL